MKMRELGKTGIEISPVGYGCMGLSHAYGEPLSKEDAADRVKQAYEMGYNFFDTLAVDEQYLRRAHAVTPVSAVQNVYSMIDRFTENMFPVFDELGITLVPFTPLAKGFLSGRYATRPTFDNTGG